MDDIKNNRIMKCLLMLVVSLLLVLNFQTGASASSGYDRQEADACITISQRLSVKGGSGTKDIYRAVGVDEYYDIIQTGKFRGVEGSFAAKEFGNDFSETLDFANRSINKDKVAIIKVTIPGSTYNQLHHMNLDARIFKSGTPVVELEMLDFF